ncbi:MAG: hypothetical protein JXQ75_18790 [Phycisphaerae bacterium]|nr:hypothetical protein [Phycisphaerae bacterium]
MNWRFGLSMGVLALLVGGFAGCARPLEPQRMNAPPQGDGLDHPEWADYYVYHNDQGMMADMSIADIHFVPGSDDLSGTGVARLERYAELLATRGGTLHYTPTVDDEALIKARVTAAEAFLAQAIPSKNVIEVVVGLAGGRGMEAKEAVAGKAVAQTAETRGKAYNLSRK